MKTLLTGFLFGLGFLLARELVVIIKAEILVIHRIAKDPKTHNMIARRVNEKEGEEVMKIMDDPDEHVMGFRV